MEGRKKIDIEEGRKEELGEEEVRVEGQKRERR